MRDVCSPAARATATGAAESHSYWPPLCTYASASPQITAAAFAPAEPSGTSIAPVRSASCCTKSGGLVRLTTYLSWPRAEAEPLAAAAGRACAATGRVPAGQAWPPARPSPGRSAVLRTRPCAGSATAPAVSSPRSHSATCTAQSVRPGSPNSLVPSSGSTIHTRSALSRAGSSRPSSESTASPGRVAASLATRNSCDCRSPLRRRSTASPSAALRLSSNWPAWSASS